jgi:hypothetical protein
MAGMTTGPDTFADTQEMLRAIEAARDSGLTQASGAGFAAKLNADDQSSPDQALADNPHVNVSDQIGMAAFDLAVRGAISAKYNVQIQTKQFHDEFSMTGGDGSLKAYFEEMFEGTPEEKKKKENEEALREAIDNIEDRRREERAEWSRTRHSYAGIEMTGEEWGKFAERMEGDTPLRKWLLERQRQKGKTEPEAKQAVDQMVLLAKMQNLPPDQWTPEMQALDTTLKADPKLEQELQESLREAKNQDVTVQVEEKADIAVVQTETSAANGADALSQSLGAKVSLPSAKPDALVADSPASQFPSAPNLAEHHRAAMTATEPLDPPKQIAALPTPAPTAPGSGFDV